MSFSKKGHAFLNFGGKYPEHIFTGFIPAQNVEILGGEKFLQSLTGNQVTITGKIELCKGRKADSMESTTRCNIGGGVSGSFGAWSVACQVLFN